MALKYTLDLSSNSLLTVQLLKLYFKLSQVIYESKLRGKNIAFNIFKSVVYLNYVFLIKESVTPTS